MSSTACDPASGSSASGPGTTTGVGQEGTSDPVDAEGTATPSSGPETSETSSSVGTTFSPSTSISSSSAGSSATSESPATDPGSETGGSGCSDGVVHDPEQCDGVDLDGQSCESLGYLGGTLACDANCGFDVSACWSGECGGLGDLTEDQCPSECDSCDKSGSVVTCYVQPDKGDSFVCPDGVICQLLCLSPFACHGVTVFCDDEELCAVECEEGACGGMTVHCGGASTCRFNCSGSYMGVPSCSFAEVDCGLGSCDVDCSKAFSGEIGPLAINDCESACDCSLGESCPE